VLSVENQLAAANRILMQKRAQHKARVNAANVGSDYSKPGCTPFSPETAVSPSHLETAVSLSPESHPKHAQNATESKPKVSRYAANYQQENSTKTAVSTYGAAMLAQARARDGIKTAVSPDDRPLTEILQPWRGAAVPAMPEEESKPARPGMVKIYPDMGTAAIKAEKAAAYRVYLACQHMDQVHNPESNTWGRGAGWLDLATVREQLTTDDSQLRLFSWRRLRQVLQDGSGIFWEIEQDDPGQYTGRLWLNGAAKVAASLHVERLTGRPVALPIAAVTSGIGEFKARLHSAWLTSRKTENPISQETIKELTSIPERTQRHYCQVAKTQRRQNYAIGKQSNKQHMQDRLWKNGRSCFEFIDYTGKQGRANAHLIAWRIPNSYSGPYSQTAKGRQRKVNCKLKDLVTMRARGNSGGPVNKMFFDNPKAAAKARNRIGGNLDAFWPASSGKTRQGAQLWHVA
jgi:hypothetical protein